MNASIRNGLLASMALLALAATRPQTVDAASLHGAIAYSSSTGAYGTGTGWSAASAENQALYECRQRGGGCQVSLRFQNAWGALAVSSNGYIGTGTGYNTANPSNGEYIAKRYAMQFCKSFGGTNCRVVTARSAVSVRIDNGTNLIPASN
jgi:Domain of unknown function (DUF4189)